MRFSCPKHCCFILYFWQNIWRSLRENVPVFFFSPALMFETHLEGKWALSVGYFRIICSFKFLTASSISWNHYSVVRTNLNLSRSYACVLSVYVHMASKFWEMFRGWLWMWIQTPDHTIVISIFPGTDKCAHFDVLMCPFTLHSGCHFLLFH